MKKLALSLLLMVGALALKAQQTPGAGKLAPQQNFKFFSDSIAPGSRPGSVPLQSFKLAPETLSRPEERSIVYSRMPVAQLHGRYKMPIVQTDVTGYTMPVLGKHKSGSLYHLRKDSLTAHP